MSRRKGPRKARQARALPPGTVALPRADYARTAASIDFILAALPPTGTSTDTYARAALGRARKAIPVPGRLRRT